MVNHTWYYMECFFVCLFGAVRMNEERKVSWICWTEHTKKSRCFFAAHQLIITTLKNEWFGSFHMTKSSTNWWVLSQLAKMEYAVGPRFQERFGWWTYVEIREVKIQHFLIQDQKKRDDTQAYEHWYKISKFGIIFKVGDYGGSNKEGPSTKCRAIVV